MASGTVKHYGPLQDPRWDSGGGSHRIYRRKCVDHYYVTTAGEHSQRSGAKERACPQCGEPAAGARDSICMVCGALLPPPGPEAKKADTCPQCGEPGADDDGLICMVCGTSLVPLDDPPRIGRTGGRRFSGLRWAAVALVLVFIAGAAALTLVPSIGAIADIGTATVEGGGNLILQATCAPGSVDIVYQGTRDGSQLKVLELGVVSPGTDTALNLTRYLSPEPGTVFGPFPTVRDGGSALVVVARPEYADGSVVTETIAIP